MPYILNLLHITQPSAAIKYCALAERKYYSKFLVVNIVRLPTHQPWGI
jgi:hypothetical protein